MQHLDEDIPKRWGLVSALKLLTLFAREPLDLHSIFNAEREFDLAELSRLEATRVCEEGTKACELCRGHGFKNVNLSDQRFEDLQYTLQVMTCPADFAFIQLGDDEVEFMEQLLEPELVDLVNDNKEGLVVLGLTRSRVDRNALLKCEQLGNLEVRAVGEAVVVFRMGGS